MQQPAPPTLDPQRVANAKLRAEGLILDARYFESRARAARSQADLLGRTWGFDAGALLDDLYPSP